MIAMYVLRMLSDLAFYGAFAGFMAVKCGGTGAMPGILLCALAYGLSGIGGSNKKLRMILLLPMAAGVYLHRQQLADVVMLLPAAAYVSRMVWQGDYNLCREKHQQSLMLLVKALAIFTPLAMIMWSTREVTAASLPYGLLMMTATVLLLRSLRHDPSVYCSKRYQLSNLCSVTAVVGAAYLISRKEVTDGVAALFKVFYQTIIWPVLEALLKGLFWLLNALVWLWNWLNSLLKGEPVARKPIELDLSGFAAFEGQGQEVHAPDPTAQAVLNGLMAAAAVIGLYFFFRWLKGRHYQAADASPRDQRRESLPVKRGEGESRDRGPIRSIRKQYRKFLKTLSDLGSAHEPGHTSLDVHRRAAHLPGPDKVSDRIRAIYINARYNGQAQAEDAQQMKKLCSQAKEK